ncbi:terminase large subunit [Clostridium perfringens]|uniref:terminase large subunit n=1 Tax=Clostridium phage PhiS63 TaxID=1187894 RepID=UPI00025F776F|nr:terminase TerL endonuclease subunit [Clostridium perfringens]YP_006383506.1 terminase large subunit [Clostridium phage PhiS63]AFJ96061.1 gp2 [Clostridium phage PhiS63]EJT6497560.1 terminase large subunit [Clostridium perfringens]MDK0699286.1 terminase large subunit [Clostridium perfringens]MDU4220163.1 terminase TerL endonuclease subunit [Clostridium perfringens]NGT47721.1 terminase large subunit [Clostridium perfringens]
MITQDEIKIKEHLNKKILIQKEYILDKVIDKQKEKYDNEKYFFDESEARKIFKFLSKLTLDKGKKGSKVKLLRFQFEILTSILCVKNRETGFRRFKEAHLNIGRKNGKGSLVAWIIIYLYFTQDTYGAEYIIVANDIKQATNLFNTIKLTINNNKTLRKYVKITDSKKEMYRKATNSTLRVLSNEGGNLDSYASYIVVLDEVHEYKSDEAYSKLITGMGLWDDPIMFTTTTASSGEDEANLEYQMYSYSKQIESGEVDDESFYYAIYEAEKDCDIFDIDEWSNANPALGCFKKIDDFIKLAKKALAMKTFAAKFRRLYLNQHIATDNIKNAINMDLWRKCTKKIELKELKEYKICWCGLDLSSVKDITAFVMVFYDEDREKYIVYPHLFTPKDTIMEREDEDKNPYSEWISNGDLIALEGKYINFELMMDYIYNLNNDFDFEKLGFDRWGSPTILNRLEGAWDIVPLGQGFQTMTPFINDFEALLIDERLIIAKNEVFEFMAKNVIAVYDDAMNVKYSKKKSKFKIDGIIAMIMGLGLAVEENEVSHYDPFAELEEIEE